MRTIAIVANSGWNLFNYRVDLIRALHQNGWRIILYCPYDEYVDQIPEDIYDVFVPLKWLAPRAVTPFKDLLLWREMKRNFSSARPDLILTFTFKPNIFGKWAAGQTPVIGTVTGLGTPFMRGTMIRRIAMTLYKKAYRSSGVLFFHNERDRQFFMDNEIIFPDGTDVVPGSGIDTEGITPVQPIDTGRTVFLFLGRIMPEKGIVELLEAANVLVGKHRNVSLILAGRWIHSGKLKADDFKRMTAHPRVRYLGHLDELESVWAMADCLVLPSYREGLSRSMLEAMARAVPVIASDVPGCEDLLREGGGWLVKAGDPDGLLNTMEHVISLSQEEKRSIGLQGRKIVESDYSIGSVAEKYQKKAEELTST